MRLNKYFFITLILILLSFLTYGQPSGGGPGGGGNPYEGVPINGLAILLVLIAKGLGIYKIIKSKKKK